MILFWILLLGPLVWLTVYRYRRRHMYKLASLIRAPDEELPIIGMAHTLQGNTEDILRSLHHISDLASTERCNGICRLWLGHILYFVMTDPVDAEYVLKTCLEKDDLHRFLRAVLGNGVVFAPVSIWRRRRKTMVPAFSPKVVDSFMNVFSRQGEILAQQLGKSADKGDFPAWPFISTYTLDSVFQTALGCSINAQENPNSSFLKSVTTILNIVCVRVFHIWLQPNWMFKFSSLYGEHERCKGELQSFTDDIINKKRESIKKEEELGKEEGSKKIGLGEYQTNTFLDLLIKFSGGETGYTNLELREEVLTLIMAGTDTSATAIGFTLKLLAKYPEMQERIYNEGMEIFGDSERPLDKEDLTKMKFLERFIKESLRLFPPAPFIIRKVEVDTTLPSGRVIPAGSGVGVSIWGIHRDPKHWGPQAEHFDPDRFLPERLNLAHACCYMPFSNGPRNCLGYQYALMSVKTGIANIVRRYIVKGERETGPIPKIRVKIDIMMKDVDDYRISLEKRKPHYPNAIIKTT